ncbi:hypothetical protein C2845_PM16G07230 [Panicum miliaceum]|uniref:LOB domain-containing protein n=1 Tax=Panicum miliaceum TaxID=4540 RepID=A0A3L6PSW6_PANMI|nr:hypothetical protein C2845_PM16G07230 [Panicum miliaceum]
MSAPPAPQGAPTWSPPSGGANASESEPDSPSSDGTSSPPAPATGSRSSIASSSTPPPAAWARAPAILGSGGGSPPPGCAACRHKRQQCPPGCALAPYFPADDPDRFRSVLWVFGVKNLLRTLREVPRPRWDACVRTIVHESRMRLADPVRGCVGAIEDLEAQLVDTAVELEVLRRRQEAYQQGRRRGLRLQPLNPRGRADADADAALPRGVTNLGVMQPQGPYGGATWPDDRARRDADTVFPDAATTLILAVGDDRAHRDAATTLSDGTPILRDAAANGNAPATYAWGNSDGTRRLRQRVGNRRRAG